MKRSWGIIACILLFAGCHTSKRPVLFDLNEHNDVGLRSLQEKHPFQESAYLFYKYDISHDLKPDVTSNAPRWYYFESYHWKEVVLEGKGKNAANFVEFDLGPDEKVRSFKARVSKPGEKYTTFKKKDLTRKKRSNGSKTYFLDVDGIDQGTTIEVALEVERDNLYDLPPMSHDVPLQLDKPVEYLEFAYTYPEDWSIQVKQLGSNLSLVTTESADKRAETKKITYSSVNVPAFEKEVYGPYFKQIAPYFHVKVNHLEVGNVLEAEGDTKWEEVAKHHEGINISSKRTRDRAEKKLQDLGISADMRETEKVRLVMAHIQSDIWVLGEHTSGDVWKDKRGNPFEVTRYASMLFEAADIKTDFLVAHTASDGFFDEEFVSTEQIKQPLLRAHISGESVYLFPSLKGVPEGYIPVNYVNQVAHLFTDKGYEGFASIPSASRLAYKDAGHYDLFINGDGEVRAEVVLELGQHSTYEFNQALMNKPEQEAALVGKLLAHNSEHISMLGYRIDTETTNNTIKISASYDLDGCLEPESDTQVVESCGLFEPINEEWYPFTSARSTPFVIPGDLDVTNNIRVIYPEAWSVTSNVQNVAQNRDQVIFERTHRAGSGQMTINQHLIVKQKPFAGASTSFLANSIQLPLGTTLSSIELTTTPQLDIAAMRTIPSDPGGPWTLVVSSMESYEAAVKKVQELEGHSDIDKLPMRIFGDGPVEGKYHILIGMYSSRQEVETARIMFADEIPFDSWIAVVNPQMTAVLTNTTPVRY